MILKKPTLLVLLFLLANFFSVNATAETQQFDFRVFLNDDEIGSQQVLLEQNANKDTVSIESELTVKVLFFNAYSYQHSAKEAWQDQCLVQLDSSSKEKGDRFFVNARGDQHGLSITSQSGKKKLSGCIHSFAYWDIQRLKAEKLLNAQTGEYVPARFSPKGQTKLDNGNNKAVSVMHYVLHAEDTDINIFYDNDEQWVALQTKVKGGRTLSYYRTPHVLPVLE